MQLIFFSFLLILHSRPLAGGWRLSFQYIYSLIERDFEQRNMSSTTAPIIFTITIQKPSHQTDGSLLHRTGFVRVPDTAPRNAWCIAVICWSGRLISVSSVLPSGHLQYSRVFTPAVVYTGPYVEQFATRHYVVINASTCEDDRTAHWIGKRQSNRQPPDTHMSNVIQCVEFQI